MKFGLVSFIGLVVIFSSQLVLAADYCKDSNTTTRVKVLPAEESTATTNSGDKAGATESQKSKPAEPQEPKIESN